MPEMLPEGTYAKLFTAARCRDSYVAATTIGKVVQLRWMRRDPDAFGGVLCTVPADRWQTLLDAARTVLEELRTVARA